LVYESKSPFFIRARVISKFLKSKIKESWVWLAHNCNLSYLGGRDLEDHHSRTAQAKVNETPISACSCDPTYVEAVDKRITM
jgi:hypothetical protein